ncbi:glutamine amidotransferase [uncultured Amnibacterium sp.]|uniref:glutamine amidotransferase n=1 Tax=uncultured Amnibacterium sp. TaxID=1631851 RepID=UPI0035CB436D
MSAVLVLHPELTDVNGDARNAAVLATRAGWAGVDVAVRSLHLGEEPTETPLAVVLGSTTDPALPRLLAALHAVRDDLAGWIEDGVPVLAIGTGLEALTGGIRLPDGRLEGLGLVPGDAEPLAARVTGDLVVDAAEGRLVGYENHSRGLRLEPGVVPLGPVTRGVGDGRGVDGVRHGSVLGTRLHGPVLAKNPALADAILAQAFGRPIVPEGAAVAAADAAAKRIRDALLAS